MKTRPNILLTNDDGLYAPGMKSLWQALHRADFANLYIIAPLNERSGSGVSITFNRPLSIRKVEWPEATPAWSIDGSPADCVKMGTRLLLDLKPDLIVSGINAGSNAGRNVLHSGTVGAVIEGTFRGIPGIAFSCEDGENPNFSVAEKYVPTLTRYILDHPLSAGSFLNVNIPHAVEEDVRGFRLTRQGKGRWTEEPVLHQETEDERIYWLGGKPEEVIEDEDCDTHLLKKGYLTAVPIFVHQLTDMQEFEKRKHTFDNFRL